MRDQVNRPAAVILVGLLVLSAAGTAVGSGGTTSLDGARFPRVGLAARDLSLLDEPHLAETAPPPTGETGARSGGADPDRKNPMVALLMSVVLPGWGEMYTGHTTRGRAFMAAEGAIWVGYAAFTVQGNMRTHDYQEYATVFAGVSGGVSDTYYQDIADYIRNEGQDSYNEAIRREARSLYPDDLEAQRDYFEEHGYFSDLAWEWESAARFDQYRDLRHDASISFTNAFYMTGLAVLNRAVSAIDSAWMARRYNQGRKGEPGARFSIAPEFSEGSVGSRATLTISF